MNNITKDKITLLSKKGMKELKKAITQLEKERQRGLRFLHELDKTFGRDERLTRIEKISELESLESELNDKRLVLSSSRLLPDKRTHLQVTIGSVVDLIDKYGHLFRYTIVNSVEANPSDGRISTLSPLGHSLLGRNVKEVVVLNNGKRKNQFKLTRIT